MTGVARSLAVLPLFVLAVSAHAAGVPESVRAELRRLAIPETAASIWIAPVDGTAPIVDFNSDRPMNPASTMKLVTTYAALEALGPAFTWKTRVYTRGQIAGGTLTGDLLIRGAGDPKLVVENLWLMLGAVRARGVSDIAGDIVIDRSLFDPIEHDPSQFDGEPLRPYNVGPDALLLNFKSITLHFVPDAVSHSVRVYSVPQLAGQDFGVLRYAEGPCGDVRGRIAADFSQPDHVRFAGSYPASCGEKELSVSVYSHQDYDSALIRSVWTGLGGHIAGVVRDGPIPVDASLLEEYESPALGEVVRDINKFSNNVMARELYLSLGAEVRHLPGNAQRSAAAINQILTERGLAMPELVIDNGSGLSRTERIAAASLGRLLVQAFASPIMPEFMASLPMVGIDGTMRRRLTGTPLVGQAHIKTGTLADCRAIAGYVLAASGKRYAVVALLNHPNAPAAQSVHDAILQWIYEHG